MTIVCNLLLYQVFKKDNIRWCLYVNIIQVLLVKNLPAMQESQVRSLVWEDPMEKAMTTHSSILAWRIPWTEEPGGLQSMESQRVRHNWSDLADMQDANVHENIDETWEIVTGQIRKCLAFHSEEFRTLSWR